uniref:Uncharacterized protein n=1 Tax=Romanomermis culicivorax TaxID=13658 RepID=A0A915JGL4_ROMCU
MKKTETGDGDGDEKAGNPRYPYGDGDPVRSLVETGYRKEYCLVFTIALFKFDEIDAHLCLTSNLALFSISRALFSTFRLDLSRDDTLSSIANLTNSSSSSHFSKFLTPSLVAAYT